MLKTHPHPRLRTFLPSSMEVLDPELSQGNYCSNYGQFQLKVHVDSANELQDRISTYLTLTFEYKIK